ncbi:putative endonuclease [Flavobacteriaceae bacterium MAR_2010_72]|nr:putative endonuclease [Flavobacteriaceae bacterium MAR_2010_72]
MKFYYVYILLCADKSYYTGITHNLEQRLEQHQNGTASIYTSKRLPVQLKWYLQLTNPNDAITIEKQIKGWSRKKKQALIDGHWDDLVRFSKNYMEYGRQD